MLKIGLIGAGFMGGMHSACYEALRDSGVKICAVADVDDEKAKAVAAEGAWDYSPSFPFCMEYRVKFEKATVVFNSGNNPALVVYPNEGGQIVPEIKNDFDDSNDIGGNISSLGGYYNELKYFTERLNLGLPLEVAPLSEGVKSLELVLREIEMAGGAKK